MVLLRTPNSQLRTLRGFTLIEIVIVTVIIAILATASIPRLSQTAQRLRAEHAAFEMVQLLRLAHERAVSESTEAQWVWDDATRRVRVEPSGTRSAPLPEGIAVQVSRQGEPVECACVRFFPGGTSEPVTVTVGAYRMTIDEATSQVFLRTGTPAR